MWLVTNVTISLDLRWCGKLKRLEGNFQALRKLNLSLCGLKDGEIGCEVGELSNLQELDLYYNDFTQLDFSLSRLTRLKLLDLSFCSNLVELPELPSSLAILKANNCKSLGGVIRDEIHTNCKWLSHVSVSGKWFGERKNFIGGERLLKTMFQGNGNESGCMSLKVSGFEIARGFEPRLFKGERCRMQLPENWFNDFSGFLFCTASNEYPFNGAKISMKHVEEEEEENGGLMGIRDSQHWEDHTIFDRSWYSWVGYIPFSLLRRTSWWDPTSTAIHMEIQPGGANPPISWCRLKMVPKRGGAEMSSSSSQMETTTHSSEISLEDDNYNCKLYIIHDSKSEFKFNFAEMYYDYDQ